MGYAPNPFRVDMLHLGMHLEGIQDVYSYIIANVAREDEEIHRGNPDGVICRGRFHK